MKVGNLSLVLVALVVWALPSIARASEIAGTVADEAGNPIKSAHVTVEDQAGNLIGQGDPDAQGQYSIAGLATGTYNITLIPLTTQFQRRTVQGVVEPDGLCLDWTISPSGAAIPTARRGAATGVCTPPAAAGGLTPGQTATIALGATGAVTGGIVGILAGVGVFDAAAAGPPASPAQ
jgi:hypothetical protein